jgi:hemoglobin/transferrin/lactoferrin receptor protein
MTTFRAPAGRLAAVALALLLLTALSARAADPADTVRGVVKDTSGSMIAGASVALLTGEQTVVRTTRSDDRGEFAFEKVPAGRYVLMVTFPGFADRRFVVSAGTGGKTLEVVLEPTPVQAEVTVTATAGAAQDRQGVAQATNVIEATEIAERAKAVVAQAVSEEAGLNIVRTSPTMAGIYVRGLTGNKVNVFIDGVRYSNSAQRGGVNTFLDLIEPTNLQAIEVLRGPSSAQYGSDALGGSVQFLSVLPGLTGGGRPVWRGAVSLRGGTADQSYGANITAGLSASRFGLLFNVAGRQVNDFRPGGGIDSHAAVTRFLGVSSDKLMDSRLPDTGFMQYGGMLKLNWTPTNSDQLVLSYSRGQQERGKRYDQLLGGDGNLVADLRHLMLDFFYLRYNRADVGFFDQVTATYSFNTQREERVNQGGNGNPRNSITHEPERMFVHGFQLRALARSGDRQELLLGGDFYPERIDAPSTALNPVTGVSTVRRGRVPDGATYKSFGAFAQESFELVPNRLKAVGGIRFGGTRYKASASDSPVVNGAALWPDDSAESSAVTFRAGLVASPIDGLAFTANVSRGFRAPHITDLGTLGLTGSGFTVSAKEVEGRNATVGNAAGATALSTGRAVEQVKPETSLNYEAAVSYRNRRFSTEASVFINNIHDNIAYQALILPAGAVGTMLGDQAITSQGATGVVYVPASSSPVLVRTNYDNARITGLEHSMDVQIPGGFSLGTVLTVLHAKDMATGLAPNIEGGTPGPDLYVKLRWSPARTTLWVEPVLHVVGTQDRLSTLDLEDRRTGSARTRTNIRNFFLNGATARGWVSAGPDGTMGTPDDILIATGETFVDIQNRVLGSATSAALYTSVKGYTTIAVRGGFRVGHHHEFTFEFENLTDENYRGIAWGVDALGRGLSVGYTARF